MNYFKRVDYYFRSSTFGILPKHTEFAYLYSIYGIVFALSFVDSSFEYLINFFATYIRDWFGILGTFILMSFGIGGMLYAIALIYALLRSIKKDTHI